MSYTEIIIPIAATITVIVGSINLWKIINELPSATRHKLLINLNLVVVGISFVSGIALFGVLLFIEVQSPDVVTRKSIVVISALVAMIPFWLFVHYAYISNKIENLRYELLDIKISVINESLPITTHNKSI